MGHVFSHGSTRQNETREIGYQLCQLLDIQKEESYLTQIKEFSWLGTVEHMKF